MNLRTSWLLSETNLAHQRFNTDIANDWFVRTCVFIIIFSMFVRNYVESPQMLNCTNAGARAHGGASCFQ